MFPSRHYAFMLLLIFFVSCTTRNTEPGKTKVIDTIQQHRSTGHTKNSRRTVLPKFSSVDEVVSDTTGVYWGNYADNPISILHFTKKGFLQIEYYGQCWYTYSISLARVDELGRCIVMQWNDDMDCRFDIGFNKLRNNIPKPTKRSRFAIFNLQNDTLFAHYLYPEWVREMNKKDTSLVLFPESFAAKVLD